MKGIDPAIVQKTRDTLAALGSRRGPIIVGPWLSEIGFELLYWIPFLRWACAFAGLHPEDLWIVSRGGCRSWYADISPNYVDVFDFYTPDQFMAGNARRMAKQASHYRELRLRHGRTSTKQHMVTGFDKEIVAQVIRSTGLAAPRLLHPSMMYGLFRLFWRRQLTTIYTEMATPKRLTVTSWVKGLPASYVAAKFYASQACPNSPVHSRLANDIVRTLAASTDVVLLHGSTRYDEHRDFKIDHHPRVHRVAMDTATNLETQSAVMAGASAFVGTYGGFAYLAPFLGVPARTFYAQPNFRKDHRQLMDKVCQTVLRTPFTVELIGGGSGRVARRRLVRHAA